MSATEPDRQRSKELMSFADQIRTIAEAIDTADLADVAKLLYQASAEINLRCRDGGFSQEPRVESEEDREYRMRVVSAYLS